MKFKIGDKVRVTKIIGNEQDVLNISGDKNVVGMIGSIIFIHTDIEDEDNPIRVRLEDILDSIYFSPLELELVEKKRK